MKLTPEQKAIALRIAQDFISNRGTDKAFIAVGWFPTILEETLAVLPNSEPVGVYQGHGVIGWRGEYSMHEVETPKRLEEGTKLYTIPPIQRDYKAQLASMSATEACAAIPQVAEYVESLEKRLAEKDAEIEQWKQVSPTEDNMHSLAEQVIQLSSKLAENQAREANLRELIKEVEDNYFALLKEKDTEAEEFKAEGDMYGWNFHTGMRSGAVQMHLYMTRLLKALSTPSDAPALNALNELIAKAGEVMRERAREAVSQHDAFGVIVDHREDAGMIIHAIPGVTLEDLK